jgi:hypothetical protein
MTADLAAATTAVTSVAATTAGSVAVTLAVAEAVNTDLRSRMSGPAHETDPWAPLARRFARDHYATIRGQVRTHVIDAQLRAHLPPARAALVDVGGGAGNQSIPLERRGYLVTIVDPSSRRDHVRRRPGAIHDSSPPFSPSNLKRAGAIRVASSAGCSIKSASVAERRLQCAYQPRHGGADRFSDNFGGQVVVRSRIPVDDH